MSVFSIAYNRFKALTLFCNCDVLTFQHRWHRTLDCQATIRTVNADNLADALVYESHARVEFFRRCLERGDLGYYAYLDERWVHRSWVRLGPLTVNRWRRFAPLELGPAEAYIHYCETDPIARGHGVYPAVLSKIAADLSERVSNIYISSLADNTASCSGIIKAGFEQLSRVRIIRFLGVTRLSEVRQSC